MAGGVPPCAAWQRLMCACRIMRSSCAIQRATLYGWLGEAWSEVT